MRIISQDGLIDIPYEMAALQIVENINSYEGKPWEIHARNVKVMQPIARYSTKDEADKATLKIARAWMNGDKGLKL